MGFWWRNNAAYSYSSLNRNFELHSSEQTEVILKILLYAGVVIRDPEIIQVAASQYKRRNKSKKLIKICLYLNGGLITETNRQYYAGAQQFQASSTSSVGQTFTSTFDTNLTFGSSDNALMVII